MKRRIVYGAFDPDWNDQELAAWASVQIGCAFPDNSRAIGMEVDDEMVAVTVWNCFEEHNCLISIASDKSRRWMTREYLFRSFYYPFAQLGLPRVTVKVDEDNLDSVLLGVHLGFNFEGAMRKAAPGGRREIIMGLLKEDCRWISDSLARHSVKYSTVKG